MRAVSTVLHCSRTQHNQNIIGDYLFLSHWTSHASIRSKILKDLASYFSGIRDQFMSMRLTRQSQQ